MTLTALLTSWVLTACLSLVQSAPPEPVQANIDVLQIAKGLGDTTYRDFRYAGGSVFGRQVKSVFRSDATSFVERVGMQ